MLLNKGEIFLELVREPLCMSLIEHLLGPDYLISCVDAQIQHPGSGTRAQVERDTALPRVHPVEERRRSAPGAVGPL